MSTPIVANSGTFDIGGTTTLRATGETVRGAGPALSDAMLSESETALVQGSA
jgi:hypothetical protein